jgi:hypothetical protein
VVTCAATRIEKNCTRARIEVAHYAVHNLIVELVLDWVGAVDGYPFFVDLSRRKSFLQIHDAF